MNIENEQHLPPPPKYILPLYFTEIITYQWSAVAATRNKGLIKN